jgi:hypothetical protein
VTVWAAVVAYNPGLVVRRKQVLHTVLARTAKEVVAHTVAAEAARAAHSTVGVADPIVVVHKAIEVAHRVIEVARIATVVVDSDLAAAVGLDHKTWIIPSCQICKRF